jgi:hypothetical protein
MSVLSKYMKEHFDARLVDEAHYESGMDGFGYYYQLTGGSVDLESVREFVGYYRREMHDFRCGHQHDCCGCAFISSIRVMRVWESEDDWVLVHEDWGRNY